MPETYPETQEYALNFEGVVTDFYLQAEREKESEQPMSDEQLPFGEQGMGIDESYFASNAEEYATNPEHLEEDLYAITHLSDDAFTEFAARLYLIAVGAERALGTILWQRLRETLGFEKAKDGRERSSQIWQWAVKLDRTDDRLQYRLDKFVRDAMARELEPRVSSMSITAGDEIARNVEGDNEDVVRDTIAARTSAVESLDPDMANTTDTVRAVKALEQNGNRSPKVLRVKNLNPAPTYAEYLIVASIKVSEVVDENGEIHDEMEMMPVVEIGLVHPQAEALRDQFKTWQDILLRKLGKYDAYYGIGEKDDTALHAPPDAR